MPTKLRNIHNSCYMNSILQCLVHVPELNEWFNVEREYDEITKEFNDVRKLMLENPGISPYRFLHYVQSTFHFQEGEQHDAHELLIQLYDHFKCPLYQGEKIYHVGESITKEAFTILELHIPREGMTLLDCLQAYCSPEEVEYEGKKVMKRCDLQLPPLLTITLVRTHANTRKNDWSVAVPQTMGPYELVAVCNHHGTSHHGHYTATVLENTWYECNDEHILELSQVNVNHAYCLFFRKKTC
jgi:ubiquitin C-terminal hydrolase